MFLCARSEPLAGHSCHSALFTSIERDVRGEAKESMTNRLRDNISEKMSWFEPQIASSE